MKEGEARLAHPTVGAELSVVVDASATHVGACLQQRLPGKKAWQPLGFFSKKLEAAQQKYSAFDRELFACFAGICHFRYMLDGRRFAIFTDHKPLTYALARVSGSPYVENPEIMLTLGRLDYH